MTEHYSRYALMLTLTMAGQLTSVNAALVSARGFGEADPIPSNVTRQGRAQNRRVGITIAGSGS
jgi:outer membrane protein OmpA-like peptidoglycan-associated protein